MIAALALVAVAAVGVVWTSGAPRALDSPDRMEAQAARPMNLIGGRTDGGGPEPVDSSGAFLYRRSRFSPLGGVPGAGLTSHVAIDNHGRTAGLYLDAGVTPNPDGTVPPGSVHGFIEDRQGRVSRIDVPDAGTTLVVGLNDGGQLAGTYLEGGLPGPPGSAHGFVRNRNGSITTIDVPGAVDTYVTDINNRGQVVGHYAHDNGDVFGFLRDRRGRITTIDPPGGAVVQEYLALNDLGQVVGQVDDRYETRANEPNSRHGFVWEDGRLRQFDVPESSSTGALGINNRGQITGGYFGSDGREHGFVAQRGRYSTIDAPGRSATDAWGINDRGDVVIPGLGTGLAPTTT